jgi:hypothetical protein
MILVVAVALLLFKLLGMLMGIRDFAPSELVHEFEII